MKLVLIVRRWEHARLCLLCPVCANARRVRAQVIEPHRYSESSRLRAFEPDLAEASRRVGKEAADDGCLSHLEMIVVVDPRGLDANL